MIRAKAKGSKSVENLEKKIEALLFVILFGAVLTVLLAKNSVSKSAKSLWSLTTQYTLESIIDDVTGSDTEAAKEIPQPEIGN